MQDALDKGGPRISDCLDQIIEESWLQEVTIDQLWALRRRSPKVEAFLMQPGMRNGQLYTRKFRGWVDRAKSARLGNDVHAETKND